MGDGSQGRQCSTRLDANGLVSSALEIWIGIAWDNDSTILIHFVMWCLMWFYKLWDQLRRSSLLRNLPSANESTWKYCSKSLTREADMSKDRFFFLVFWCRFWTVIRKSAEVLGASPAPRICPRSVPKTALTLETVHLGASPAPSWVL